MHHPAYSGRIVVSQPPTLNEEYPKNTMMNLAQQARSTIAQSALMDGARNSQAALTMLAVQPSDEKRQEIGGLPKLARQ
jgi:hypothetical protein